MALPQPTVQSLAQCTALIIDPNPTSRSVLSAQLRDFGMASVAQSGRASDARRLLEHRTFDVVLCEMDFQAATTRAAQRAQTGSELLDELRQANLLPWATVFIMVTGERSYAKVAEAAESALDSYLLKPFTATALLERVNQSRQRKFELEDIYAAIEAGQFQEAARLCTQRFRDRQRYWLYAARLGAELLLRLDMHTAARHLLDAVVAHQALPWARLGIARAQLGQQQTTPALRTLESLISDEPGYADAYDVLGRTHLAQGRVSDALETYQRAAELTPGALRRQQKLGMLAFYTNDMELAAKALDRAVILGQHSKMFDYQTLVLLAAVRFKQRDSKGLARCQTDLVKALERAPSSVRLQRFLRIAQVLDLMLRKQVAQVIELLRQLAAEVRRPDFDVEAGCNLLCVIAHLTAAELRLDDAERWVEQVVLRFAGTRGVSELLSSVAQVHPPFADRVKSGHQQISEAAEKAMTFSLAGQPDRAVEALLSHARMTLNQKFVDTAQGLLKRYAEKMDRLAELQLKLYEVAATTGQRSALAVPPGLDDDGAGRLRLRAATGATTAATST